MTEVAIQELFALPAGWCGARVQVERRISGLEAKLAETQTVEHRVSLLEARLAEAQTAIKRQGRLLATRLQVRTPARPEQALGATSPWPAVVDCCLIRLPERRLMCTRRERGEIVHPRHCC